VVLFNSRRSRSADHLGRAVEARLHAAVDAVSEWPGVDLFVKE
jgi:hypothetical protein